MSINPYQKYKEDAVLTMTAGEMLILLYDELLKRLRACEIFLDKENFDEFEKNEKRCEEIIQYLKNTLDFKYPISNELYRMYDFFMVQLSRAKASRKKETIEPLHPLVRELRDAFEQASKQVNK